MVDGICRLLRAFKNSHPGSGNYGKGRGRIHGHKIKLPEADDSFPPYAKLGDMAIAVVHELIRQRPDVHRQGYGGLVHINNHAAAIADLATYGYPELVPQALASHHHHFRLWKDLPNLADELGPLKLSKHTPHHAAYWNSEDLSYDRALLTHRVKTMFGFDELIELIEDGALKQQAHDTLRYLM